VALFSTDHSNAPRRPSRVRVGWILLIVAIVGAFGFAMIPAPYVIEQPGPVFNTLGQVSFNHKQVPLIEIPGQKTYPTSGALDLLTVNVLGSRESSPSWFDIVKAWLDPSKAILPLDSVYPPGETVKQSNAQSAVDMQNSQRDAVAAALRHIGYQVPKAGDTILNIDGHHADSVLGLRSIIAATGAGTPIPIEIVRAGTQSTVQVTPELSAGKGSAPVIGIFPLIAYHFPFQVKIQLQDVGGPSAGQMFALGIIDKLTPGKLNGGARVAGTGTIDATGVVGPIGGIRQKLYGARDAGATWFLAPYADCNEVTGHIPSGIKVLAVKTLDDSLSALKAISSGASTSGLLSCSTKN
jgi:PDZ domain-containing protein